MKEEKEDVDMCDAIREMLEDATNEGLQKGRESGIREYKKEMVRKMLAPNFPHSEIMELTGLTV